MKAFVEGESLIDSLAKMKEWSNEVLGIKTIYCERHKLPLSSDGRCPRCMLESRTNKQSSV